MIKNSLSKKILTLGPDKNGKGGMASVLNCYATSVFQPFYYERTTGDGTLLFKLLLLLRTFICVPFYVFIKRIKIVHIHGASGNSFIRKRLLIYYCSLFPVDIIFHLHGAAFHLFTEKYGIEKIKKTFSKCKRVIVLSKQWQYFIHNTINYYHTLVINNIIPYPQRQIITQNDNVIRLLHLGILGERKGIFDLLKVITTNIEYYLGKIKLIIGGNGEVEKVKQYIVENHLETIVEYVGWVAGKTKIKLLNECDVYILPSYNEGLPISILEAMSYGKTIIATNVGGIPTIVKNDLNGYLISPGDVGALTQSINKLIENKDLIKQFGVYSEKLIIDFLPDKVNSQLTDMYEDILNKK
jgi:glycosyltransferase involved in cell wall biosynthesis